MMMMMIFKPYLALLNQYVINITLENNLTKVNLVYYISNIEMLSGREVI